MNNKKLLLLSQFVRTILTIIILNFFNFPIFIKILLIMLTDSIDCGIPIFLFGPKNWIDCNRIIYQKSDKICDTISYSLLLYYIIKNKNKNKNKNKDGSIFTKSIYIVILLFLFRLIGVILFLIKSNRKYLFYFPNFFLEICLGIYIIEYFPILKKFKLIIFTIIIIYKIILEYIFHYLK